MLGAEEKPDVKYEDVGGLDSQKQEIREAVELPLTQVRGSRNKLIDILGEVRDILRLILWVCWVCFPFWWI